MIVRWKVREVAEKHGVANASQLAERAKINKNTANALWNGTSLRADRDTLAKLCAALDCTTGDLLEYDVNDIQNLSLAAA